MKKFSIPCVLTALSTISLFAISYENGRRGAPIAVFELPVQIVPDLVNLLCLVALLVLLVAAIAKRKQIRAALIALILSTAFSALQFIFPPTEIFQLGFRNRIEASVSADELRQIANAFETNVPPEGFLPGPGKSSLWDAAKDGPVWTNMTNSTSLGKLDNSVMIYKQTGSVELLWGGGLVGHWGVRIQTESPTNDGNIAPGITTFSPD
jgi:hypothetical protein